MFPMIAKPDTVNPFRIQGIYLEASKVDASSSLTWFLCTMWSRMHNSTFEMLNIDLIYLDKVCGDAGSGG